jgi:hypothetical protein
MHLRGRPKRAEKTPDPLIFRKDEKAAPPLQSVEATRTIFSITAGAMLFLRRITPTMPSSLD